VVAWVKIDDFENPSRNLTPEYQIISESSSEIISIPKGYANGLKALEPDSEILIFSNMSAEESLNDIIRFPANCWMDWNKL
jgi:dTDP-4-dehydrorhamnose 3,5-epimerase